MVDEYKIYREILKAIKIAKNNIELENDMTNLDIDENELENKLLNDEEIRNKAKEKVYKND